MISLRHFRLLSAAAAVLAEYRGEGAEGAGGLEAGREGGRKGEEIPSWRHPPGRSTSSDTVECDRRRVIAFSCGGRGAEPGSGEETLSARVVVARAGSLPWRLLSSRGAGLAAPAVSRQNIWAARRRVLVPLGCPASLSEGVLLPYRAEGPGGWAAGGSAQASPVSRRPAVCLPGGAGALAPSDLGAGEVGHGDAVGWGSGPSAERICCAGEWGRAAPFPSSWVSLSNKVSFDHGEAKAVWSRELAADPAGVEPVFWNGPAWYQRTQVFIGIY